MLPWLLLTPLTAMALLLPPSYHLLPSLARPMTQGWIGCLISPYMFNLRGCYLHLYLHKFVIQRPFSGLSVPSVSKTTLDLNVDVSLVALAHVNPTTQGQTVNVLQETRDHIAPHLSPVRRETRDLSASACQATSGPTAKKCASRCPGSSWFSRRGVFAATSHVLSRQLSPKTNVGM